MMIEIIIGLFMKIGAMMIETIIGLFMKIEIIIDLFMKNVDHHRANCLGENRHKNPMMISRENHHKNPVMISL